MSTTGSLRSVGRVGVLGFFERMVTSIFEAGEIAHVMQPRIISASTTEKGGTPVVSALTAVDLMLEDRIGCDIAARFDDVSFWGEERARDHVSALIPEGRPYIATLDPIDGTLFYRNGSGCYQIILTLNTSEGKMLGCLICRPATEEVFIGVRGPGDDSYRAFHWERSHHSAPAPTYTSREIFGLDPRDGSLAWTPIRERSTVIRPRTVILLGAEDADHENKIRDAGYDAIYPWRDYTGNEHLPYESFGMIRGECDGFLQRGQAGPLHIDSVAIGFLMRCLGGVQRLGVPDRERWTYSYHICAANQDVADLLTSLV